VRKQLGAGFGIEGASDPEAEQRAKLAMNLKNLVIVDIQRIENPQYI